MKKNLYLASFLFILFNFFGHGVSAQSYTVTVSSGAFTPVTDGTSIEFTFSDDDISDPIEIPFDFEFFGVNRSQLKLTTNGYLTFDPDAFWSRTSNALHDTNEPIIAPLWDDLYLPEEGVASYKTSGVAPSRILTIEVLNSKWSFSASDPGISFQVKLYETSNKIEFVYRPEAGALYDADASIGIAGDDGDHYYSLANVTDNTIAPDANNEISDKPGAGHTIAFTAAAPVSTPSVQASALEVSDITGTSSRLDFLAGDGTHRVVFMKSLPSGSDEIAVTDGALYRTSPMNNFDLPDSVDGWLCIANFNDTTLLLEELKQGFTYRLQVFEYNGVSGQQKYLNTPVTIDFTTEKSRPFVSAGPRLRHAGTSSLTYYLGSDGGGDFKSVFIKQGASVSIPVIEDSVTYLGDERFGMGDEIGTTGWFCVYNGPDAALNYADFVSELEGNTSYTMMSIDYNGPAGAEVYAENPETATFSTFQNELVIDYTFEKDNQTFVPLSGGTALDYIEGDIGVNDEIPIGFDFQYGGHSFSTIKPCSNGMLLLNMLPNAINSSVDTEINDLDENVFGPVIAPLWDDLHGADGAASYKTEGTAGARIFTVEYLNWKWPYNAEAASISFQVKLYEADHSIEFHYRAEAEELSGFESASIGLNLLDIGDFISLNGASSSAVASTTAETTTISAKPVSGQIFRFVPGQGKLRQTITFAEMPTKTYGDAAFTVTASSNSGLPVSFQSSNSGIASVSGNTITIHAAGTVNITAVQAGNDTYHAEDLTRQLVIEKASPALIIESIGPTQFSLEPVDLSVSSNSDGNITISSSNDDIAIVSGEQLTMNKAGTVVISATQDESNNYLEKTVSFEFTVVKADYPISLEEFDTLGYSAQEILLYDENLVYTSSDETVASIVGYTIQVVGTGTTEITATFAGDDRYNPAELTRPLTVVKGLQEITFALIDGYKPIGAVFTLSPSASSGLPVLLSTEDTDVIQIEGNTITVLSTGSAVINATQAGNMLYEAALPVSRVVTVRMLQTISFPDIEDVTLGSSVLTLQATSTSGLPVTYVSPSDKVIIDGSNVFLQLAGPVTISALQPGSDAYEPADTVSQSFCINPVTPEILSEIGANGITLTASSTEGLSWFKDAEFLSSETSIGITESGTYTLVSEVEGCTSLTATESVVITSAENNSGTFGVFPNPVKDVFVVDLRSVAESFDAEVKLLDVAGRMLGTWTGKEKIACDVTALEAGSYLVVIKTHKALISRQLVKQ